jgi:predicted metal-dependent enzyme (double-stranded beta helix superfamily)
MSAISTAPTITPFDSRDLVELLAGLAGGSTQWSALARFNRQGRWWRRLRHTEHVDIWLLTWLAGHSTDLHDHGGSAGAFAVVAGELTEVRVTADRRSTRTTIVAAGETCRVLPTTVHDVYNAGPAAAISLHAYSPPLSRQTYFSLGSGGFAPARTVDTRATS